VPGGRHLCGWQHRSPRKFGTASLGAVSLLQTIFPVVLPSEKAPSQERPPSGSYSACRIGSKRPILHAKVHHTVLVVSHHVEVEHHCILLASAISGSWNCVCACVGGWKRKQKDRPTLQTVKLRRTPASTERRSVFLVELQKHFHSTKNMRGLVRPWSIAHLKPLSLSSHSTGAQLVPTATARPQRESRNQLVATMQA
jgi:hypothetical protein